eukprot:7483706-Lingulodinium_polyedra.AAC.1
MMPGPRACALRGCSCPGQSFFLGPRRPPVPRAGCVQPHGFSSGLVGPCAKGRVCATPCASRQ